MAETRGLQEAEHVRKKKKKRTAVRRTSIVWFFLLKCTGLAAQAVARLRLCLEACHAVGGQLQASRASVCWWQVDLSSCVDTDLIILASGDTCLCRDTCRRWDQG